MDLYSQKAKSFGPKIFITIIQALLIGLSYWILFLNGGTDIFEFSGLEVLQNTILESKNLVFYFNLVVFIRLTFMMFFLLKRKIPWGEVFSVPMAFALYYIGFSFLVLNRQLPIDYIDYIGIAIFVIGSYLNTKSELQRHFWKLKSENKGKLFTEGLFKYSMHINFFGDVLWVSAYAIITRNYWAILIPILLFCLFAFWNILTLDKYLANRYGAQFVAYAKNTKKLIPFIY